MKKALSALAALALAVGLTVPSLAAAAPASASPGCAQRLWNDLINLSNNALSTEKLVSMAYSSGATGSPSSDTLVAKYKTAVAQETHVVTQAAVDAVSCGVRT
jgi:hypothetical protein